MYIPIITHPTVINKTIVYSDTVLPVKDLGNNLKVSSISNVSEYSLERCLQTVFESNPNITFNTIQYSKKEKKVYFYANEKIETKTWEDSKTRTYQPLTKSSEILEEIKNILISEPNNELDCISLYDIAQLLKRKNHEYEYDKRSFKQHFDYIINSKYGNKSSIVIYDFNYDKNELNIGFKKYLDYDKIVFAKNNGDLYVKKDESYEGQNLLIALGDSLSKLYDKFIQHRNFKQQRIIYIKSTNSNFIVNVSQYGVSIKSYSNLFELNSYSYKKDYGYTCNSNTVISALKNKENEIFQRIFVKIEDCPEWTQEILYETRKKQLEKETKLKEEARKKEDKKQKILELKRKFLPFLKKINSKIKYIKRCIYFKINTKIKVD